MMIAQLDPNVRKSDQEHRSCITKGMDQGLHNWLVYSGQLSRYEDRTTRVLEYLYFCCYAYDYDMVDLNRDNSPPASHGRGEGSCG